MQPRARPTAPRLNPESPLFLGVDAGTGGVRALCVDESGQVRAEASVALDRETPTQTPGRHEQSPRAWWSALCRAVGSTLEQLSAAGYEKASLAAVAIDGTSGTLVALDENDQPLRPAMMYNDARADAQAERLNQQGQASCRKLGYQFTASFALAKIAWLAEHEPETFRRATRFVHQADYLVGELKGTADTSDYSNALKTGYDLIDDRWPDWIDAISNVRSRLPRVVAPGTQVGTVTPSAADQTGLPQGLPVVAGASDGTAAFLASGASRPGDDNTTLGTTLVFKRVADTICRHPDGLIYSHKLPGGLWLPGAASNTGCEWIGSLFPDADVRTMDRECASRLPSETIAYPLSRSGERFPLACPSAEGFFDREPTDESERFAACLQGTALVERMAYDVLDEQTGCAGREIYATGGGSRSDVWMQCRADVTGRVLHRPAVGESAFGAALLAATGVHFDDWENASRNMVRIERSFQPDPKRTSQYNSLYDKFRRAVEARMTENVCITTGD